MNCEIINIGDELLIGQVVNTNATWLSEQLNDAGFNVQTICVVADKAEDIVNSLKLALKKHDIVIITGGLGPTKDDITKKVLCDFFGGNLISNEKILKHIEQMFINKGFPLTAINKQQAEIPDNCIVLENKLGTAPGMWFEKNNQIVISLPGVPYEMKGLMLDNVLPKLEKLSSTTILHKTIMTCGIGESFLSEIIADWEDALPPHIKLAYLPQPGLLRLRLTVKGDNKKILTEELNNEVQKLSHLIPDYIYGYDEISLEKVVSNLLQKNNLTVSIAESCTGGKISCMITQLAGASKYFRGSIIAYDNAIKEKIINVNPQTLTDFGAVSKETVIEMAEGVRLLMNTDYAIATSGIAGPDGGSVDKPVGTVYIAVAGKNETIAKRFNFADNRERNIQRASIAALNMLRQMLKKDLDE